MRTSTEFINKISTRTISTSFDFRDLVKGRLMCIVFCPDILQITICMFVLSHHAIDASSGMKLMHGRTDVLKASHYDLTRADRTITALNMSLSTECAIGDSSTIF